MISERESPCGEKATETLRTSSAVDARAEKETSKERETIQKSLAMRLSRCRDAEIQKHAVKLGKAVEKIKSPSVRFELN